MVPAEVEETLTEAVPVVELWNYLPMEMGYSRLRQAVRFWQTVETLRQNIHKVVVVDPVEQSVWKQAASQLPAHWRQKAETD